MSTKIIGITYNGINEDRATKLKALCESYGFTPKFAPSNTGSAFYEDCEIIFGTPKPAWMADYKNLKWLQTSSAGVDAYCRPGILSEDVLLTNAKGGYGIGIAEHLMMQLLMLMKNSVAYHHQQLEQKWQSLGAVRGLYGAVVTVVGLGDIGGEFAKRAKAFGAVVRGVKRVATDKPEYVDDLYTTEQLDIALKDADVVALCLPNTAATDNILNADRIAALKQGAFVLNVGRGSAIDEEALVGALNNGHLGGAGLDVTRVEPLPAGKSLWTAKNTIISPHVSGGITYDLTIDRVIEVFTDNLKDYAEGKPFKRLVNRKEGY